MPNKKTQSQKFKDLAREAECEDGEKAFDEKLKRITQADEDSEKKASGAKKNKS